MLASLLDGVRASGNRDICIKMSPTKRGYRLGPFNSIIDEEVESIHTKFLHELPQGYTINEMLTRFNVNVPYSGLINAVTQDVNTRNHFFFLLVLLKAQIVLKQYINNFPAFLFTGIVF